MDVYMLIRLLIGTPVWASVIPCCTANILSRQSGRVRIWPVRSLLSTYSPEESLTFWRDQGPFRYGVVLR